MTEKDKTTTTKTESAPPPEPSTFFTDKGDPMADANTPLPGAAALAALGNLSGGEGKGKGKAVDYATQSERDLIDELDGRGLPTSGSKTELIERLAFDDAGLDAQG